MLGKTAGGVYWMARYLERSENIARLVEAGFRIGLTRSTATDDEWASVIDTAWARTAYLARYQDFAPANVINFLLRDRANHSSVRSAVEAARNIARLVRTALTREVWEAINVCYLTLKDSLHAPLEESRLPEVLTTIRQQSALVRGAIQGTMLRNDIYDFIRVGTYVERADNTARILDVKYYVLLPSASAVGAPLDNVQWETILRSASAERAFGWLHGGERSPIEIARFLILDRRMPRSLRFCYQKLGDNLGSLAEDYGDERSCLHSVIAMRDTLKGQTIQQIFDNGLHEFIQTFIRDNNALGECIEKDYRFYG